MTGRLKLSLWSLLGLCSLFTMIFWAYGSEDEITPIVLKSIKRSPVYRQFHTISSQAKNKTSEIFLEVGNYAWGGYNAILFIETKGEVKLYSYLFYEGDFRYHESTVDKERFEVFWNELSERGIWELDDYSDESVEDGSTYFLHVMSEKRKNEVIVYGSRFFEPERVQWEIIRHIENFCLQHMRRVNQDDKENGALPLIL